MHEPKPTLKERVQEPSHATRVAFIKDAIALLGELVSISDAGETVWNAADVRKRFDRLSALYHEHGSALAGPRSPEGETAARRARIAKRFR